MADGYRYRCGPSNDAGERIALAAPAIPAKPTSAPRPAERARFLETPMSSAVPFIALSVALLLASTALAQEPPPSPAQAAALPPASSATTATAPAGPLAGLSDPDGISADQAAARAIATAPSLERAQVAVVIAEAGAQQARLGLFPNLEVSARYTRLSRVTNPDFGIDIGAADPAATQALLDSLSDPASQLLWGGLIEGLSGDGFAFPVLLNSYALRASASYPVSDLFFTIRPSYQAALQATRAQEAQLAVERRTVALQAREAFYEVARARATKLIADKALEQAEAQRDQLAVLVRGGTAARVDLLQLEARVAQAQVGVVRARGGVLLAERALQVALHQDRDAPVRIAEDFSQLPDPPAGDVPSYIENAMRARAEVLALEALEEAREDSVRAELGRRYPQLLLQGGLNVANPNQRIVPQRQRFDTTWDLSVVLRWSPNEYGDARQRVLQAQARIDEVRADRRRLEDAVRLEVEQAFESYRAARETLMASSVSVRAAEETYRVRVDQLRAGSVVTTDLLDAETALLRARLEGADAAIGLRLALTRLRYAMGDDEGAPDAQRP
ncbi:MAG: TolC family protein [Myxococcota bacterium]